MTEQNINKNILELPHVKTEESLILSNLLSSTSSLDSEIFEKSSICKFELMTKLGEGTFGVVRLAKNLETGEKVAIKIIERNKLTHLREKKRLYREIKNLKQIKHPNVVQLYSVFSNIKNIYLIMEYINGIELFDYIQSRKKLPELEACRIYQQIISGIEYMQKQSISHRDIKPENILIEQKYRNVKIVDFGLSNNYTKLNGDILSSACGSPSYAAPEMLTGKAYKAAPVDIWSSGIVLYAMVCGYLPFQEDNNERLYKDIREGKYTIPNFISKNCKDLLHKILNVNPKKDLILHK